jgi:hypothetical protein
MMASLNVAVAVGRSELQTAVVSVSAGCSETGASILREAGRAVGEGSSHGHGATTAAILGKCRLAATLLLNVRERPTSVIQADRLRSSVAPPATRASTVGSRSDRASSERRTTAPSTKREPSAARRVPSHAKSCQPPMLSTTAISPVSCVFARFGQLGSPENRGVGSSILPLTTITDSGS